MKRHVLITTRSVTNDKTGETRDCLDQKLWEYFLNLGYLPFLMPNFENEEDVEEFVDAIDPLVIVLSGGNNISPTLYNRSKADINDVSLKRDMAEKKLLTIATHRHAKVLGICRGMQMINVYFGGKLANIKNEIGSSLNHVASTHPITIKQIGFMPSVNEGTVVTVNSYHDYGFTAKDLSKELEAAAISQDEVVEIIEHPHFPILGIMWHPERPGNDHDFVSNLIKAFLLN